MKRAIVCLCAVVVLSFCLAQAAYVSAEILLDKEGKAKIYSDFRLRQERDWDSTKKDGTEREDRDRTRIRFRLGLNYQPLDYLSFNVRARTGAIKSQQSPHITVIQRGLHDIEGDFFLDKAVAKLVTNDFWFKLGRDGLPFWRQNELLWDDDVYLDGSALGYTYGLDDGAIGLSGGFFALPDGEDKNSLSDCSKMGAAQVTYNGKIAEGDFAVAGGLLLIDDKEGVTNSTNQDQDYRIWSINLQYKFKVAKIPLAIGADYMHNDENYPSTLFNRNARDGYIFQIKAGQLENSHDWLLGYYYAYIEKYAVAYNFAQDDWLRWGTATQTRSSNFKGHEIRIGYAFTSNFNAILRVYLVEAIARESAGAITREDGKRTRLGFNYKP